MINQYTFLNNEDEKEEKEGKDNGTMMTKRMEEIYLEQRRVYFWGPVDDKSMEKVIEVNLGIGMNMLFPETVKIVIEDDTDDETTKKSSKVKPEIEIEKEQ